MSQSDVPQPPALARAGIDRAAHERDDPQLLDRLRADPATRVLAVHGDLAPLTDDGTLLTVAPSDVTESAEWAFLGRKSDGVAVLLAATAPGAPAPLAEAVTGTGVWSALRAVGGSLDGVEAGLLVEAVSLGRWLVDAPFCPRCGGAAELRAGGWARTCTRCGREHFPRTDPAVIVAVESADGARLLLGKNAQWASRNMYSTFAGFVEAGESLESAIVREVFEEAGVHVEACTYRGSQAWPYPRSLMLGFRASVAEGADARADGVEIVDVRWFTREQLSAALAGDGEMALPGTASIAHRLIVDWVEGAP